MEAIRRVKVQDGVMIGQSEALTEAIRRTQDPTEIFYIDKDIVDTLQEHVDNMEASNLEKAEASDIISEFAKILSKRKSFNITIW